MKARKLTDGTIEYEGTPEEIRQATQPAPAIGIPLGPQTVPVTPPAPPMWWPEGVRFIPSCPSPFRVEPAFPVNVPYTVTIGDAPSSTASATIMLDTSRVTPAEAAALIGQAVTDGFKQTISATTH